MSPCIGTPWYFQCSRAIGTWKYASFRSMDARKVPSRMQEMMDWRVSILNLHFTSRGLSIRRFRIGLLPPPFLLHKEVGAVEAHPLLAWRNRFYGTLDAQLCHLVGLDELAIPQGRSYDAGVWRSCLELKPVALPDHT